MSTTTQVNPRITDAVTQDNVSVLGQGPALSVVQSYMSLAQAQGVLFANMVANQQQAALIGQATTAQSVRQLLRGGGRGDGGGRYAGLLQTIGQRLGDISRELNTQKESLTELQEKTRTPGVY